MAKRKLFDEDGNEVKGKMQKPFYKKWWFWLIVVIIVIGALSGGEDDSATEVANETEQASTTETTSEESIVEEEVVEEPADDSNVIALGESMELGDYTITFQSYALATDYEGKDALVITYDWINNSEEAVAPFMTFMLKGFQDGVETGDSFMVDGVDLGIGQKEVRPGSQLTGAQTIVGIEDLSKPLELELDELISFTSTPYNAVLDLSSVE